MIKKITLLLAVLLCTMAATAATTTYKGTMKTSNGTTEMTEENSVVELDRTLLIHYKATVKDFKIMIWRDVINFGDLEFSDLSVIGGSDGYKTIKDTKQINLADALDGVQSFLNLIPEQFRGLVSMGAGMTYPVTIDAKFNDKEFIATFETHITISAMNFNLIDQTITKEFHGYVAGEEPQPQPDPALYLVGSFNNWNEEAMVPLTKGADGKWTVTQAMDADAEFKLKDEQGNWLGAVSDGNFIVTREQVTEGTALTLSNPGMNFQIPVAGEWTLTVDKDNNTMTIAGDWPEPQPEPTELYILGEVNENRWAPNVGVAMDTEDHNIFTATITADGRNDGFNYFSFTTRLAENENDWDAIAPYRIGAVSDGDFWVTDDMLNTDLSLQAGQTAFKIPAGEYDLTVNCEAMTLVIKKLGGTQPANGDVNGDGKVDVEDVNAAINIILKLKTAGDYPGNADLNGDGKIDVEDVNAIINLILKL